MANSKLPPQGIHPVAWNNIKAKRNRELKAETKALYQFSPILWAVVKGFDTRDELMDRLDLTKAQVDRKIVVAVEAGYVHFWGGKYQPLDERHKQLKKRWAKP
jgi:hypothetical protein